MPLVYSVVGRSIADILVYSVVGRSIADIYVQGVIFTKVRSAEVNMCAEVEYRSCGPTYRTINQSITSVDISPILEVILLSNTV